MGIPKIVKFAIAALLVTAGCAHPAPAPDDMVAKQEYVKRITEALHRCMEQPRMKEIEARLVERRAAYIEERVRKEARNLPAPPVSTIGPNWYMDNKTIKEWSKQAHSHPKGHPTNVEDLFHYKIGGEVKPNRQGCALAPQSIYGPFWEWDEPKRRDIRLGQPGVHMRLVLQVIDVATCMPVKNARVDLWHANAKGEYSAGKPKGFLRGYQSTSKYGTVEFPFMQYTWSNDKEDFVVSWIGMAVNSSTTVCQPDCEGFHGKPPKTLRDHLEERHLVAH